MFNKNQTSRGKKTIEKVLYKNYLHYKNSQYLSKYLKEAAKAFMFRINSIYYDTLIQRILALKKKLGSAEKCRPTKSDPGQ